MEMDRDLHNMLSAAGLERYAASLSSAGVRMSTLMEMGQDDSYLDAIGVRNPTDRMSLRKAISAAISHANDFGGFNGDSDGGCGGFFSSNGIEDEAFLASAGDDDRDDGRGDITEIRGDNEQHFFQEPQDEKRGGNFQNAGTPSSLPLREAHCSPPPPDHPALFSSAEAGVAAAAAVNQSCSQCQAHVLPSFRFCNMCGAPAPTATPTPPLAPLPGVPPLAPPSGVPPGVPRGVDFAAATPARQQQPPSSESSPSSSLFAGADFSPFGSPYDSLATRLGSPQRAPPQAGVHRPLSSSTQSSPASPPALILRGKNAYAEGLHFEQRGLERGGGAGGARGVARHQTKTAAEQLGEAAAAFSAATDSVTPSRPEDTLCRFFAQGKCRNGRDCKFLHDSAAATAAAIAAVKKTAVSSQPPAGVGLRVGVGKGGGGGRGRGLGGGLGGGGSAEGTSLADPHAAAATAAAAMAAAAAGQEEGGRLLAAAASEYMAAKKKEEEAEAEVIRQRRQKRERANQAAAVANHLGLAPSAESLKMVEALLGGLQLQGPQLSRTAIQEKMAWLLPHANTLPGGMPPPHPPPPPPPHATAANSHQFQQQEFRYQEQEHQQRRERFEALPLPTSPSPFSLPLDGSNSSWKSSAGGGCGGRGKGNGKGMQPNFPSSSPSSPFTNPSSASSISAPTHSYPPSSFSSPTHSYPSPALPAHQEYHQHPQLAPPCLSSVPQAAAPTRPTAASPQTLTSALTSVEGMPSRNLYVHGFGQSVNEAGIETLFGLFCEVTAVVIKQVLDRQTGEAGLRYCFVWTQSVEMAQRAKTALHGFNLNGQTLSVSFAKERNKPQALRDLEASQGHNKAIGFAGPTSRQRYPNQPRHRSSPPPTHHQDHQFREYKEDTSPLQPHHHHGRHPLSPPSSLSSSQPTPPHERASPSPLTQSPSPPQTPQYPLPSSPPESDSMSAELGAAAAAAAKAAGIDPSSLAAFISQAQKHKLQLQQEATAAAAEPKDAQTSSSSSSSSPPSWNLQFGDTSSPPSSERQQFDETSWNGGGGGGSGGGSGANKSSDGVDDGAISSGESDGDNDDDDDDDDDDQEEEGATAKANANCDDGDAGGGGGVSSAGGSSGVGGVGGTGDLSPSQTLAAERVSKIPPSRNLFVSNFPGDVTEQDMAELFGQYCEVTRVVMKAQYGYCFVWTANRAQAQLALTALHGLVVNANPLQVAYAKDNQQMQGVVGRGGGGLTKSGQTGGGRENGGGGSGEEGGAVLHNKGHLYHSPPSSHGSGGAPSSSSSPASSHPHYRADGQYDSGGQPPHQRSSRTPPSSYHPSPLPRGAGSFRQEDNYFGQQTPSRGGGFDPEADDFSHYNGYRAGGKGKGKGGKGKGGRYGMSSSSSSSDQRQGRYAIPGDSYGGGGGGGGGGGCHGDYPPPSPHYNNNSTYRGLQGHDASQGNNYYPSTSSGGGGGDYYRDIGGGGEGAGGGYGSVGNGSSSSYGEGGPQPPPPPPPSSHPGYDLGHAYNRGGVGFSPSSKSSPYRGDPRRQW